MDKKNINYIDSINDALKGSMDAYEFLYKSSLPTFKKEVMKFTSNPNDIDDILQEAYIKIFSNLDTLQNANSFIAWGRQICDREAMNAGKRNDAKKNDYVLMPDTSDDEENMGMDEVSADTYSTEFNPEAKIDAAETKRLMDEMLDGLTENQRLVICMWEEQYSFKEIAEELGMPENTVKSHFNRGKKALETKVKDLEKKGTKLYEMAPFPFFLWVISQFDQLFTPNVDPELNGSMMGDIIGKLPPHAIDITKSSPRSIKKYGTDAMKQELGQQPGGMSESVNHNNYAETPGNANGQPDNSASGNTTNKARTQSGENNSAVSSDRSTSDQNARAKQQTSQGSAQGTASAGAKASSNAAGTAASTVATSAGTNTTIRIIIAAIVVAVIGIGGFIGYRTFTNRQPSEDDTQDDTPAQNTEDAENPEDGIPAAALDEAETAESESMQLASELGLTYIGNQLIMSETEITETPSGCLSAYANDFDNDGEDEILAVELNSNNVDLTMYESDNNQWVKSSNYTEALEDWTAIKGLPTYDTYQYIYFHILGNDVYISDTDLFYMGNAIVLSYSGNNFTTSESSCNQKEIYDDGGFCLTGIIFSYASTDRDLSESYDWGNGSAESYILNLIDYTDMSTYDNGTYEFSYPKYFDEIGVEITSNGDFTNIECSSYRSPDWYNEDGYESGEYCSLFTFTGDSLNNYPEGFWTYDEETGFDVFLHNPTMYLLGQSSAQDQIIEMEADEMTYHNIEGLAEYNNDFSLYNLYWLIYNGQGILCNTFHYLG